MKTMRDTEVHLTSPMLRHALREWEPNHRQDHELIECFAAAVKADEHREAIDRSPIVYLSDGTEEIAVRLHFSPTPPLMVLSGNITGEKRG